MKHRVVRLLLASGAHDAGPNGCTLLLVAAADGRKELVRELLNSAKVGLNDADELGYTPLHLAAVAGHPEIVRFLCVMQADPQKATCSLTPLHSAAHDGHADIVQILLDFRADATKTDCKGWARPEGLLCRAPQGQKTPSSPEPRSFEDPARKRALRSRNSTVIRRAGSDFSPEGRPSENAPTLGTKSGPTLRLCSRSSLRGTPGARTCVTYSRGTHLGHARCTRSPEPARTPPVSFFETSCPWLEA